MNTAESLKTTRRDFMRLGAAVAAVPAVASAASVAVPKDIPVWAKQEIDAAVKRFLQWKGQDETVAFVAITDVHARRLGISNPPDYSDRKMHIPLALHCAERIGADFFADLGDQDLEWACTSPTDLRRRIQDTIDLYKKDVEKRPVLFCLGNHDHGRPFTKADKVCPVTNARFGEAFNSLAAKAGHPVKLSACKSWGYLDLAAKKTRVFFLNSSDSAYYGFSREQLQFVIDGLASLATGWQATIMDHFCIHTPIGSWLNWKAGGGAVRGRLLIKIVEDFVWRAKGGEDGLAWDFTQKTDNSFAGFFFGDSHFDNQIEQNFVHYTISQGYGGCGPDDRAYGARFSSFSCSKQCLFDIIAFKRLQMQTALFRVGAGGAACDRSYPYDRRNITKCSRW